MQSLKTCLHQIHKVFKELLNYPAQVCCVRPIWKQEDAPVLLIRCLQLSAGLMALLNLRAAVRAAVNTKKSEKALIKEREALIKCSSS